MSHLLLAIARIFIFFGILAVVIPTYFSDPLYGMLAGATEKIRVLRTLFGHRKISTVLILGALAVAVALLDEIVGLLVSDGQAHETVQSWFKRLKPVFGAACLVLLAVSYWADSTVMVTRRDLSFHVPMYLVAVVSALLVVGTGFRMLTGNRLGQAAIALCICFTFGTCVFADSCFESNQNLKSLFWRRGVIAKRYLSAYRSLTQRDMTEFNALASENQSPGPGAQSPGTETAQSSVLNPQSSVLSPQSSVLSPQSSVLSPQSLSFTGTPVLGLAEAEPKPRNVIFLSIDTLRADHMGIYGSKRPTTPNLDRFAQQSLFCEHSYSTGTNTGHSFSSIFRSALGDGIFDGEIDTVQKVFEKNGYQTACITSPKTKTWLYKGRWFEYKKIMMDGYGEIVHEDAQFWKAKEMTDRSIALLKRMAAKGPFFAWVHYTDPHAPYENHAECSYGGKTDPDVYDSEITYTDMHIGRLLAFLNESGLMQNTMIVLTSDHGEGFGEHGALEHGCLPYIEQNFVPIWAYTPDLPGKRISAPVSHLDLAPTMLGFAGLPIPTAYEGIDLVKLAKGEVQPHPFVITETPRNIPEPTFFAWALTEGDWKIIFDRYGANWQVYNLKNDPHEQRNLVDLEPAKFAELKQKMSGYLNQQAKRKNYSNWKRFL
ncbi:MAG: sulfatase [Blastocatellia bacterium]|nr:sulfatase [Blastocatellia bacterium]